MPRKAWSSNSIAPSFVPAAARSGNCLHHRAKNGYRVTVLATRLTRMTTASNDGDNDDKAEDAEGADHAKDKGAKGSEEEM